MFTGLVESVGEIAAIRRRGGSARLTIASSVVASGIAEGESIAVDGVCLTVAARRTGEFEADVVAETLSRTTLARARPGQQANLERALRLADRLGGHLVQGHVDATARVLAVQRRSGDWRLRASLAAPLRRYVVEKGSVALHGVSLTVAAVRSGCFEVALVPQTLERTTLGGVRVGQELNLEVDLVARYLEQLVQDDTKRNRRTGRRAGTASST